MPIIDIEIVAGSEDTLPPEVARKIADFSGELFGSATSQTWVKLKVINKSHYAENRSLTENTPCPVFVSVIKKRVGLDKELKNEASQLAEGIGKCLNRPKENVHIIYEGDAVNRIAFGGDHFIC